MAKPDKNFFFWIVFSLFTALYFCIKWYGSHLTESLFNDNIGFLNTITGATGPETLDFYRGRMEEVLWGPLMQLISGLLLTFFALRFLKSSSVKAFWLSVFLFLCIAKFEVLFFPLYGDAIGGPFAEARWLAEHNFDYIGLFHQNNFSMGGPKVYLTSIYPTLLAVLIKLIPSSGAFLLVNHLLTFAMAAMIIALLRVILLKIFAENTAILVLMAFLSLPIFQSQVEAVNMEIPSVFFAVIAAYFMIRKDMPKAAVFAVIAMFFKDTAIVMCGAVFAVSLSLFFFDAEKRYKKQVLWGGMAALLLAIGKVSIKFILHDQDTVQNRISFLAGWPSLSWSFILVLYFISFTAVVFYQLNRPASGQGVIKWVESFLADHYVFFVMFACASVWFLLFLNFFAVSPRYRLLLSPFLILGFIYAIDLWLKRKNALNAILIAAISLFSFSSYGLFYTPMEDNDHVLLERSLEYRNDLKMNMILAKEIEKNYSHLTVNAPFIMAQLLAFPQLGYVDRHLDVMMYGMRCTYGGIKNFDTLKDINILQTVWVGVKTQFFNEIIPGFAYPVGPNDRVLKEVVVGNKKATIFVGGFAVEKARIMLQLAKERAALKKSAFLK